MKITNKLKITVFTLLCTSSLLANELISFESPFSSSGYKKALDCCMQVWGDICVLRDNQEINSERSLLIDAVLGRITFLDAAISEMLAHEAIAKPQDADMMYLARLVSRLETCCDQLIAWDPNEKVRYFKPLIKKIQSKLFQSN